MDKNSKEFKILKAQLAAQICATPGMINRSPEDCIQISIKMANRILYLCEVGEEENNEKENQANRRSGPV